MTGDVALQITILIIGYAVFGLAMIAGWLTMRQWYRADAEASRGEVSVPKRPRTRTAR